MRTKEVISKVKRFRDYFDFDIVSVGELKTKKDCLDALHSHRRWLDDACGDAQSQIDEFIKELGIEYEGM